MDRKPWYKRILFIISIIFLTFLAIIFLLPKSRLFMGFQSVEELKLLANTLDEWRAMENDNIIYPNYDRYYRSIAEKRGIRQFVGNWQWILNKIGLKGSCFFSVAFFYDLLKKVIEQRSFLLSKKPFIQEITLKRESKIIVFGSVQGAFHALSRYLSQLEKMGLIDKEFHILDKKNYIVFLGNVVNRSCYSLEVLSIVLKLMEANPENVVYLKGTHEGPENWDGHTLKREMELRVSGSLSVQMHELEKTTFTFFDTLPLSLYASSNYEGSSQGYFHFSPSIRNKSLKDLLKNVYKNLNGRKYQSLKRGSFQKLSDAEKTKFIRVKVSDITKRLLYEKNEGLRLLPPSDGVVSWTVLSTSIEPYRVGADFFYDAFVIIDSSGQPAQEWVITLFNRDIRSKSYLFNRKSYDFLSGIAI